MEIKKGAILFFCLVFTFIFVFVVFNFEINSFNVNEFLPFVSSQPQKGGGGPIAQPLPIPREPKTFLKVPFKCNTDTLPLNDIILAGAVYVEGGEFGPHSMFNDFYYPRCYGVDDNCNIEQHTVRLLDKDGKVVGVQGTTVKAERTFNVDCLKMGEATYYAYVPYSTGMDVVSVQLDSEDKICVAGLNPSAEFSDYYVFINPNVARAWCEGGWGNMGNSLKEGAYVQMAGSSYRNPDRQGTYGQVFAFEYDYETKSCEQEYFVGEVNYYEEYPLGTLHGKNTLVSITHPFYGEINDGVTKRGGGDYCNGVYFVEW